MADLGRTSLIICLGLALYALVPDDRRYRESYFEYFPGVWRHGDFMKINARGGCYIYGRSDSTLNRHGVRIGSAEIYRALERIPDIRLDGEVQRLQSNFINGTKHIPVAFAPSAPVGVPMDGGVA